jgi:tetratricopeptide (TPR) repeat protein
MGNYGQAILDFRKSRLLADDPDAAVALANAYLWAGRHEEAISELLAVLKTPAAPASARVLLERTYRRLGRDESLAQFYSKTLAEFPESAVWLTRAGAFAIDQRDFDEALKLYGKAYRLAQTATSDARQGSALRAAVLDGYLHSLILSAGDPTAGGDSWRPERLDELFREAAKHVDTDWAAIVFYRMAEARKKLGDDAEAGRLCRQAVDKAWSNDRLAMEILLRVRRLLGPEDVWRYCRGRLAANPDSLAANATMFHLARIENDYDDAVEYVDKCIALSGSEADAHRSATAYTLQKADLLTVAYQRTSDKRYLQAAVGVYESLERKMPTNHSVLNNLAYLLAQNDERLDEAQRYAERALNANPDQAAYLDTYALILHKKGNDAAAVRFITAAVQQYEVAQAASATAYEHLGMIKEGLGDKAGALAAYRHARGLADEERSDTARRLDAAIERLQMAR